MASDVTVAPRASNPHPAVAVIEAEHVI